ncbi:MAG TPA: hypothetical protein VNN23_10665 [Ornithinibacter sp.]|nr:hypothetical protein [Ornithinibacter sp.]
MARPLTYPTAASFRWLTVSQIAKEIDRSEHQTRKLLNKVSFIGLHPRRFKGVRKYPASSVEVLKAMLSIPHRPVPTKDGDWLSTYEKG